MTKQTPSKYTVNVTKQDGMKSVYYVAALSEGGAEETCLREVYSAQYAIAFYGWPETVKEPDLISKGVMLYLAKEYLNKHL